MMSRTVWGVVLFAAAGMLVGASAQAGCGKCEGDVVKNAGDSKVAGEVEKKITLQTTCPVMGGAIDKSQYVDSDGKRIYMCCKGCAAAIKKDPAKYIKKLEADGVTVAKLQTVCPMTGEKIDKKSYVDHAGKRIYVCGQMCVAEVTKDPAKYIKQLEESGVALDQVPEKSEKK